MRFTNPPQLSPKAPYWGSHSAPASRGSQLSPTKNGRIYEGSTKDLRRIYQAHVHGITMDPFMAFNGIMMI